MLDSLVNQENMENGLDILMRNIVLFCFMLGVQLFAQDGSLIGIVTEKNTGTPIVGVNIYLPEIQKGVATNQQGQFKISALVPGKYTIKVSHIGYKTIEKVVQIGSQPVSVDFSMQQAVLRSSEELLVEAERSQVGLGAHISSATLSENTPDDIGDFFREIPGTSAIKKGAFCCDPVIRGTTGEQLNLQVDNGIKVVGGCPNRMDPATAHMQSEDLAKIEVINGPYSVRFGPNMSGLVNMVMQKPANYSQLEFHSSFEGGYETVSEGKKSRFTLSGGQEKLNFYFNAGIKQFSDYEDAKGTVVPAHYDARDFSFKSGYNFSSSQRLQVSARESRHKDVDYPALPMDADKTDTHIIALDYLMSRGSGTISDVHAKVYKTDVEHVMSNLQRLDRSMNGVSGSETSTLGARFEMQIQPVGLDKLFLGSEFYALKMDGLRTRTGIEGTMMAGRVFNEKIWPDAGQTHAGLFAEAKKSLAASTLFSAGLRYDLDKYKGNEFDDIFLTFYPEGRADIDFGNFSAHAGVEYTLDNSSVSLKVGQGVRSPAIKELYINRFNIGNDGFEYLGNPALEAEQNRQVDLTFAQQAKRYYLSATLFYSSMHNYISAEYDADLPAIMKTVPGVKRFSNIDQAVRKGGELRLDLQVLPNFSLNNALAYTHGENVTADEPLMEIPPLEYKVTAKYMSPKNAKNYIRLTGRIVAEQERISSLFKETTTPGFNVWDIAAGYEVVKNISLIAGVENIFDTWYREHLNRRLKYTGMAGQYFYEPGRNVYLYVKYVF
ncbi:MAG: TonB-dependent receptor [Calditrichaeota bacterium]|nr:MAG: TonB-dependent receptor [Calditrichota bacterium]